MGNFAVAPMREGGLDDSKLDFYQFPKSRGCCMGEDAPTDTFHIPSGAKNKDNARAFLQFVASAEVQTEINDGDNLGQLPVNASRRLMTTSSSTRALTCCPTTHRRHCAVL